MKNLLQLMLIATISFCTSTLSADEKPNAPENITGAVRVSAEELVKLIYSNPDLVLIDSRKHTEFLKGHIEGAVNILNTQINQEELQKHLKDKNSAVLFYCNGPRCMRSSDSVKKAISWGYKNIFWFRGGWQEWSGKKLPIVTGK